MGDLNGWVSEFNGGRSNCHGIHIEHFAAENNLTIQPIDKQLRTRYDSRGSGTTVDYILSKNINVNPVQVGFGIERTDHRPLYTQILNTRKAKIRRKMKLVRKVHLLQDDHEGRHKFRNILLSKLQSWKTNLQQLDSLNEKAKFLDKVFIDSFDDTFGKKWVGS